MTRKIVIGSRLSRLMLLASVAWITLPAHEVHAQTNRATACDILTAHPDDGQRVSEPVPLAERDPARAILACEQALRADPNNPRLRYQLGLALDSAGRLNESFAAYQQAAQAGYVAAGHALAWAYGNGEGVARDDAQAVRWYRWAADRGHAGSMNTLGFMLENGRGVPRDATQAADWYRRTHETHARSIATFNYARLLAVGRGVPKDVPRAVQLLRSAVQQGRADAALHLALMAERGEAPQVTPAELIQLLALAESGSGQRDRAQRSISQQITQGNGTAVEAARRAVAERGSLRQRDEETARQQRERAFAQITQPATAALPAASTASSPPLAATSASRTTNLLLFFDGGRFDLSLGARSLLRQTADIYRSGQRVNLILSDNTEDVTNTRSGIDDWRRRVDAIRTELTSFGVPATEIGIATNGMGAVFNANSGSARSAGINRIEIELPQFTANPPAQQRQAVAAPAADTSPSAPAPIRWVTSQVPQAPSIRDRRNFTVPLSQTNTSLSTTASAALQQASAAAEVGRHPVLQVQLADAAGTAQAWDWSDPDAWARVNSVASELMRRGVQPSEIVVAAGSRAWTVASTGNPGTDSRGVRVIINLSSSQAVAAAPNAAAGGTQTSTTAADATASPTRPPTAPNPATGGISAVLNNIRQASADYCDLFFEFKNRTGHNITLAFAGLVLMDGAGRIIHNQVIMMGFAGRDFFSTFGSYRGNCREIHKVDIAYTSIQIDGRTRGGFETTANQGARSSLVSGVDIVGGAALTSPETPAVSAPPPVTSSSAPVASSTPASSTPSLPPSPPTVVQRAIWGASDMVRGVEYVYYGDGSCVPRDGRVCLSVPSAQALCRGAKDGTRGLISGSQFLLGDANYRLLNAGRMESLDFTWGQNAIRQDVCTLRIVASGIVNGNSDRRTFLANVVAFIKNDRDDILAHVALGWFVDTRGF